VRENQRQKVTVEKMDVIGEEKIGHLAPSQWFYFCNGVPLILHIQRIEL
jgi:hypothetical protein